MYYFAIVGDFATEKTEIFKPELFEIEKVLPMEVALAYQRGDEMTPKEQRQAAKLLSISYHCMGGYSVMCPQDKRSKVKLPHFARDEYLYAYIRNFLVVIQKFDRTKGAWGQYAKWIRGMAIRDTINYLRKLDKARVIQNELLRLAEAYKGDYYLDSDGNPMACASDVTY
jgi:hypothetical protein